MFQAKSKPRRTLTWVERRRILEAIKELYRPKVIVVGCYKSEFTPYQADMTRRVGSKRIGKTPAPHVPRVYRDLRFPQPTYAEDLYAKGQVEPGSLLEADALYGREVRRRNAPFHAAMIDNWKREHAVL